MKGSYTMNEEHRDAHISVLQNKDSLQEERIQSLFQLMNVADEISLRAIYKCLREDPCEIVRHEAAFVLGETAAYDAIDELKRAVLEDPSGIVKHESLLALGTIAQDDVIDFLKSQLDSKVRLVSESAKIALQRIELEQTPYRGPDQFTHLKE